MFCVRKLLIGFAVLGTLGLGSNHNARADTISFILANKPHSNQENVLLGGNSSGTSAQYTLGVDNNFVTDSNADGALNSITFTSARSGSDIREARISLSQSIAALPESTRMLLIGGSLAGIAAKLRRRRRI